MTAKNFCAVVILLIFLCTVQVEAKIVTNKLPLLTYAEINVSVYDAPDGTKRGTIQSESSLVFVKQIRADGWAYGSYKVSGKKKRASGWFRMDEVQGYADFENYTEHTNYDVDVYRTRSSTRYVGRISSGEDIIVVAKRGDRAKVIFKADGNYYKMGWISKTDLSANSGSSTSDYLIDDTEIYAEESEDEEGEYEFD